MAKRVRITKRTPGWVILILVIVAIGQHFNWWHPLKQAAVQNQPGLYPVVRDVDGDTIVVNMNGSEQTIRMIGVDTPETHDPRKSVQCFGVLASAYTSQRVSGTAVRLVADEKGTNRDRYNRLLRYVYLQDGTLLNQNLIEEGYGFAYTGFPFTKKDDFVAAEKMAQSTKKGLWGSCTPSVNQYGGYTSNDAPKTVAPTSE